MGKETGLSDRIQKQWAMLSNKPGGKWLFSMAIGKMAPYSGTIGALARRIMLLLLALATYAFGLSMVRTHPYFPLTLFIFTLPLAGLALRMTALRRCSAAGASWVLGCAFLFAAFVCLLVWVLWLYGAINGERRFWFSNRLHFSNAAQCNTTEFEPAGLVEVDGIPRCTAA